MSAWIPSAALALLVNLVSSVSASSPSQVVDFAKCHEVQTKHFLMEGGVGTADAAPCIAPTQLQTLWASHKSLLDSADSTAADLQQVSSSYKEMSEALKPLLRELPLNTAEIQPYLLSKMAALTETLLVQAVFALSNVNRSSYSLALKRSLDLWQAAYDSVTAGDLLRGIPELTEQCTMRYMLRLQQQWEPFHSSMIDVVDAKAEKTIQMLPKSDDMQDLLQKAIASLTGGSCTPQEITEKQWFYGLKRLNYVRKNIHKAVYHLFELEMLYRLSKSGEPTDETTTELLQDQVRHELADAASGLQESLRGTETLPVPPTQEIVDALLVVRTQFDAMKATIEKTLKDNAHSTDIRKH